MSEVCIGRANLVQWRKKCHKLDLVGVGGQMGQRWHQTSDGYTFFYGNGNENNEIGTGFYT
jgi:hypothetical protein